MWLFLRSECNFHSSLTPVSSNGLHMSCLFILQHCSSPTKFIMAAENTERGIPWCLISANTELSSYCSDSPSAEDSHYVWVVILDPRPLEVGRDLPISWDKAFGSTSCHSKMRISISLYRIIVKCYYWIGSFFPTRGNTSLLPQSQEQECHCFILLGWCGNCWRKPATAGKVLLFPRAGAISVVVSEWQGLVHPQKIPSYSRSQCLLQIWFHLSFSPFLVVLQLNQWGQLTLQRGSLIPQPWRERTPVTVWAPPWASPHLPAPH